MFNSSFVIIVYIRMKLICVFSTVFASLYIRYVLPQSFDQWRIGIDARPEPTNGHHTRFLLLWLSVRLLIPSTRHRILHWCHSVRHLARSRMRAYVR